MRERRERKQSHGCTGPAGHPIHDPPVRGRLLPRAALIERLNQGSTFSLLLSAGAGLGKTTLLSAWASQYPHQMAWLSLDRRDNDPLGFWSAALTALRTRFPDGGEAGAQDQTGH